MEFCNESRLRLMFMLLLLLLLANSTSARFFTSSSSDCGIRNSFPPGFILGTGVSESQDENEITDFEVLESVGVDSYKFTLSWSKILPDGGKGKVDSKAIHYYNNIIDSLLQKEIKPVVTLFRGWGLPEPLKEAYDGWLGPQIIEDFREYAELCFAEFGDRVKHWITFESPNSVLPEFTTSTNNNSNINSNSNSNSSSSDISNDKYRAMHHMLLAHAAAVESFRSTYQKTQGGIIGVAVRAPWFEPRHESVDEDRAAADQMFSVSVRWLLDPIVYGVYPRNMGPKDSTVQLPQFDERQSAKLRRSFDFIGLNYGGAFYASSVSWQPQNLVHVSAHALSLRGLQDLLQYLSILYDRPALVVTDAESVTDSDEEEERTKLEADHLNQVARAIRNGADVRGYMVASLLRGCQAESRMWGLALLQSRSCAATAWLSKRCRTQSI